jgi:hypothetical protein
VLWSVGAVVVGLAVVVGPPDPAVGVVGADAVEAAGLDLVTDWGAGTVDVDAESPWTTGISTRGATESPVVPTAWDAPW